MRLMSGGAAFRQAEVSLYLQPQTCCAGRSSLSYRTKQSDWARVSYLIPPGGHTTGRRRCADGLANYRGRWACSRATGIKVGLACAMTISPAMVGLPSMDRVIGLPSSLPGIEAYGKLYWTGSLSA